MPRSRRMVDANAVDVIVVVVVVVLVDIICLSPSLFRMYVLVLVS